jgi:hypothetical protein
LLSAAILGVILATARSRGAGDGSGKDPFDLQIQKNANQMISDGRQIFRFETFGDEAFWGGVLKLDQFVAGVSPRAALSVGLKVDVDALTSAQVQAIGHGRIDLDDPAVTLTLLKQNAVVGVTGFFQSDGMTLRSFGIQCAFCHSTVDDSLTFGIGHRLDGWANRDLNVGSIIVSAPGIHAITEVLSIANPGITDDDVKAVLNAWGPGRFDAELLLDGKGVNPATTKPAPTMIPNAFGLAGFNQHTWTGAWGTVTYWNALVANLEMVGIGRFFDPRLNNTSQFPVAAALGDGNRNGPSGSQPPLSPDDDRITSKLAALHFYQLAIPSPTPTPGVDFNNAAALRGDALFEGKAKCNNCHVEPLWTEPGWNLHTPEEMKIDAFQAKRAPVGAIRPDGTVNLSEGSYKTMNLAGLFVRENGIHMAAANKGRYYHDGRFATLLDVVKSYNQRFNLGLTGGEMSDLVEYLKSLISNGSAEVQGSAARAGRQRGPGNAARRRGSGNR